MLTNKQYVRWLPAAGFIAMLLGAVDPMEGSVLMAAGSALVLLDRFVERAEPAELAYRLWAFGLSAFGVLALFVLSAFGGVGDETGISGWWAALALPYLVGWSMSIWGKDSPSWVLWLGMVPSAWWLVVLGLMLTRDFGGPYALMAGIPLGATGAATIAGCIVRLVQRSKAAA
jgi:hypothetical protein